MRILLLSALLVALTPYAAYAAMPALQPTQVSSSRVNELLGVREDADAYQILGTSEEESLQEQDRKAQKRRIAYHPDRWKAEKTYGPNRLTATQLEITAASQKIGQAHVELQELREKREEEGPGASMPVQEPLLEIEGPAPKKETFFGRMSGNIEKMFAELMATARRKVLAFKAIFTSANLKQVLSGLDYRKTKEVPFVSSEGDGVAFVFGYGGHGNIAADMEGIKPELRLDLPEFLEGPLKAAFSEIGFAQLFTVNPAREWAFKVALLSNDLRKKKLGPTTFVREFVLLLARLIGTKKDDKPRYPTFEHVLAGLSPFIATMLHEIYVPINEAMLFNPKADAKAVKLTTFLKSVYKFFVEVMKMPFSKTMEDGRLVDTESYEMPTDTMSVEDGKKRMLGLMLRLYDYYHALNDSYKETSAGEVAIANKERAVVKAKEAGKVRGIVAKNRAVTQYQQSIPGTKDLGQFAAVELANIYDRVKDSAFRRALANYINPVLRAMGMENFTQLMINIGKIKGDLPAAPVYAADAEVFDEFDFDEPFAFDEFEFDF